MIEYFFWEGCPSHERALPLLRAMMDELEIPESELVVAEIVTQQDAERHEFIGSPTIRIDGRDIADTGDATYGLDCRIYYTRAGRPSPLPDRQDLEDALSAHADRRP